MGACQDVGLLYFSLPGFSGQGNLIKPGPLMYPGPPPSHATQAHPACRALCGWEVGCAPQGVKGR
jgi:hypothetical protein